MTVRLVAWNSRGAKWDTMWNHFVETQILPVPPGQTDDVVGLITESGWAPWIAAGVPVTVDTPYPLDTEIDRYDPHSAQWSSFCLGVGDVRTRSAFWIPWVATLADMEDELSRSNSRCSMGGVVLPHVLTPFGVGRRFVSPAMFKRPIVGTQFKIGRNVEVNVLLVHLVASGNAVNELDKLMKYVPTLYDDHTLTIVVGDFNINLFNGFPALRPDWHLLCPMPVVATQRRGGSLDWALIYNPNGTPLTMTATVIEPFGTHINDSDHSAMLYDIQWDMSG